MQWATGAIQTADQSASTGRRHCGSEAKQIDPSNTAVSIRVLSPGDTGSVTQTNAVGSTAAAGNLAATTQRDTQMLSDVRLLGYPRIQQASQSAETGQEAAALSAATQAHPSNETSNVRVHSPGTAARPAAEHRWLRPQPATRRPRSRDRRPKARVTPSRSRRRTRRRTGRSRGLGCLPARRVERRIAGSRLKPRERWLRFADEHGASGAAAGNLAATSQNGTKTAPAGSAVAAARNPGARPAGRHRAGRHR